MSDTPTKVADRYFDAIARRDLDAAVACWAPGGRENVRGQVDTTAPEGVRAFLGGLFAAMPDIAFQVRCKTVQGDRAVVRWSLTGTFCGEPYMGIEPTGARVELEGIDELRVRDGLIVENNAFSDGMTFARQIGLLPEEETPTHRRMLGAANARTKLARRVSGTDPEPIADGVWIVRGGFPQRTFNVYLVRDGDGVLCFDAGSRLMAPAIARAAASLGGLTRVVLGHAHQDHRGAAPALRVPVSCHVDDVGIAQGDGGYSGFDFSLLKPPARWLMPRLLMSWDGGPVEISSTFEEGDEIAGFRVVHCPGHAAGLVALFRESDRLALTSDVFYTADPETGRHGHPRVPHRAFNLDTEQARASVRKLAALEPAAAWPGHADPLTGDVRAQLERAAETT